MSYQPEDYEVGLRAWILAALEIGEQQVIYANQPEAPQPEVRPYATLHVLSLVEIGQPSRRTTGEQWKETQNFTDELRQIFEGTVSISIHDQSHRNKAERLSRSIYESMVQEVLEEQGLTVWKSTAIIDTTALEGDSRPGRTTIDFPFRFMRKTTSETRTVESVNATVI